MDTQTNELHRSPTRVVRELLDAAGSLDVEAILPLLSDDIEWTSPPLPVFRGKGSAERALRILSRILRSYKFRDDTWSEQDGSVFVERTELLGFGSLEVELPVVSVFRVEEGRIVVWRDYYDPLLLPVRFGIAVRNRLVRSREPVGNQGAALDAPLYWPETKSVPRLRRSWPTERRGS